MERSRITHSPWGSDKHPRGRPGLGAIALAGLSALVLLFSPGSPLARPAWASTFVVLAGTVLLTSGLAGRLVGRCSGSSQSRWPLTRRMSVLAVLLLLTLLSRSPVAQSQPIIVITIAPQNSPIAGQPFTIEARIQNAGTANQGGPITIEVKPFPFGTGGIDAIACFGSGGCSFTGPGNDTVTGTVPSIDNGDSVIIGVTYNIASNYVRLGGVEFAVEVNVTGGGLQLDADAVFAPLAAANLVVTKLGDSVARAGENFEYTIIVDNTGPSDARNVQVTDDILSEENIDFISAPGCTISGSGDSRTLSCSFGLMTPGQRREINVTVRSNQTANVQNTVRVTSDDAGPVTAQAFTSVTDVADLSVTKVKTAPAGNPVAGQTVTYRITVSNSGPSLAENVVVEDILPLFILDNVTLTPSQGTCTPGTPNLGANALCNLGNIASGGSATIDVTVTLDPSFPIDPLLGAVIQNEALVTSDIFDLDNTDNRASVTTPVTASADLLLTKTSVPGTVKAGELFHYELTIRNAGPSTAQDVVFEDTMPTDDFSIVNVSVGNPPFTGAPSCTLGPGDRSVRCEIGTLLPGTTITGTINVAVAPDRPAGLFTNSASVSSRTPDPGPGVNTASANTTVTLEADLSVIDSVIDAVDPVVAGTILPYNISVTNLGPSDAPAPVITNTFAFAGDPAGSGFVAYGGATELCNQTGANVIVCTLQNTLSPGEVASFSLFVDVAPRFKGVITNTATTNSVVFDPQLANNTFIQDTRVTDEADLSVTKFGDPDTIVVAGETLTYTIVVDNLGPSDARNVVVTDTLDSRVTFVSATPAQTSGPNPLVWNSSMVPQLARLAAEGRLTFTVVVRANQDITQPFDALNDRVEVSSDAEDLNPANNLAVIFTAVAGFSDLAISKAAVGERVNVPGPGVTLTANQVTAGRTLTYTLTVTNAGPSVAQNVVIDDTLPPVLALVSVSSPDGNCQGTDFVSAVCNVDTLPVGDTATMTVVATVLSAVADGATLFNNVTVSSDNFDPDNSDNVGHNVTTVNTRADLQLSKRARGDNVNGYDQVARQFTKVQLDNQVTAGELLQYTLVVTNTGPSDAEDVTVVDNLPPPAGPVPTVIFVLADGATCRQDPVDRDKVTCDLDTLVAGDSQTIHILVLVNASVPNGTVITDTAAVDSTTVDPVETNNIATNNTTVNTVADLFVSKEDVPTRDQTFEPDQAVAGEQHRYQLTFGNEGPSVARNVVVTDTLDLKELLPTPILGETFVRCEPVDPDDRVTCSEAGGIVTVNSFRSGNETILPGSLDSGETFSFFLIVQVDSGYVLDADDLIAEDTAWISSPTTDFRRQNNQDTEQTQVIAEADLTVDKTDISGTLECDPVAPGQNLIYLITVNNDGPSDTAPVILTDQLPTEGVVLDPNLIAVEVSNGQVLEVADDGQITVIVGEGPNDQGVPQLGRINAGGSETVTIVVPVASNATAGVLVNQAQVFTSGEVVPFTARLKGANEVPPVTTNARGLASLFLNATTRLLNFFVAVTDIDNITQAHIHRGAANINGPVIHWLFDATGTNAPDGPFGPGNPISGTVTLSESDVTNLLNNNLYVNVHTTDFPAGEVRGQIGLLTGTLDPDLTNNEDFEETTVVNPSITISKTVSLDGTCPGTENVAIGFIGQPVTYCYQVTNTGGTFLDNIRIVDTVTTRSGPFVIFDQTFNARPGRDPNVPFAPGESFTITNTEQDLDILIDCNDRPDTVVVTADPVNRGRTRLECVGSVRATDTAVVETPCKGVDWRLQLPALNTDECATWIQIQNVGNKVTKALLVLWGEPGFCPPQSFGPLKVECTGLLREGSAWTFTNPFLPPGVRSGIVYSMNATDVVTDERGNELVFADLACGRLFPLIRASHHEWLLFDRAYRERGIYFGPIGDVDREQLVLDFGAHQGEPLAVTVNRTCPDPIDPNLASSAAYVGISTDREGFRDPKAGGFAYYAPLVWADYFGLNSIIHIQNSGEECTSVELWFQQQGDCIRYVVWDILQLSPGESIPFDPNVVVGPFWQGAVWLSGSQPLGIVVDTVGANHFGSYHGVPADVFIDGSSGDFSLGTLVNYAPLIYREHQGWETWIQVQNLSSIHNAKVKVYFTDNSGGIIKTVVDWICPRGSQSFFLPVIAGVPGHWVGAARIESQDWFSPGDPAVSAPRILSVVLLEKYTDPAKTFRQETVIYNALQEMGSFDWQVGPGQTTGFGGTDVLSIPFVAKGNRGVTSELAIQNLNPNPGFTDFVIFIYDQNRLIDHVCEKLNEKQVEYIDLSEWGLIPPGFLGSLVISANFSDQQGGAALGAVAVERIGRISSDPDLPGDESKAFEAFPLYNRFRQEEPVNCPGQP